MGYWTTWNHEVWMVWPQQYSITVTSYKRCDVSNYPWLGCFFKSLLLLATKETSKLRITGPVSGDSTIDWWIPLTKEAMHFHGHLTRYVKLWVVHAPKMLGMFSPPPTSKDRASDPGMYHGPCVTHVPRCMSLWRRKRSRSRRMRNPQFYLSGNRPHVMTSISNTNKLCAYCVRHSI